MLVVAARKVAQMTDEDGELFEALWLFLIALALPPKWILLWMLIGG